MPCQREVLARRALMHESCCSHPNSSLAHGATKSLQSILRWLRGRWGDDNIELLLFSPEWIWKHGDSRRKPTLVFGEGERGWFRQKSHIRKLIGLVKEVAKGLYRARRFYLQASPDLIYINTTEFGVPVVAAFLARVPSLVHVREAPEYYESKSRVARLRNLAFKYLATRLVVNSNATRQMLLNAGFPESKITRIPNFLDLQYWSARAVQPARTEDYTSWPSDAVVVVCLARMSKEKGVADFLAAAKSAFYGCNRLRFVVIGGPLSGAYYEQHIAPILEEEWSKHALLVLGEVEDPRRWLCRSDLMVVPSHMESFGRAALEGMAMSLPVVASRVGGLVELIVHEETGFLVEKGDTQGMARSILSLCENSCMRERMGSAGRARAELLFAETAVMGLLEMEFLKMVPRGGD